MEQIEPDCRSNTDNPPRKNHYNGLGDETLPFTLSGMDYTASVRRSKEPLGEGSRQLTRDGLGAGLNFPKRPNSLFGAGRPTLMTASIGAQAYSPNALICGLPRTSAPTRFLVGLVGHFLL